MKPLYEINIHRMKPGGAAFKGGHHYGIDTNKNIGDYMGTGSPVATKVEILEHIHHAVTEWKRWDSILGRYVDPPTKRNTSVTIESGLENELVKASEIWDIILRATSPSQDLRAFTGGQDK